MNGNKNHHFFGQEIACSFIVLGRPANGKERSENLELSAVAFHRLSWDFYGKREDDKKIKSCFVRRILLCEKLQQFFLSVGRDFPRNSHPSKPSSDLRQIAYRE